MKKPNLAVIKAGLIVGTLDILSAFIYVFIKSGNPHIPGVLKFIASGIFGKQASSGGAGMMVTGLLLHYLIAFLFTFFFFRLYPRIKNVFRNKILLGVLYGIFVWAVMNLVIVPLSNVAHRDFNLVGAAINIGILIICIGLPLSFMAGAFYKKPAGG
jgi:hypothetical protein